MNNEKVSDPEAVISEDELLHGQYLLLRRGKKNLATVEVLVPLDRFHVNARSSAADLHGRGGACIVF